MECDMLAGVLNVVSGDSPTIGSTLMQSDLVRKVAFTGSTRIGKLLMKQAAETVKRVTMELGGNAPFIVFPDADLHAAARAVVASRLRNAGQTCICANRALVHVRRPSRCLNSYPIRHLLTILVCKDVSVATNSTPCEEVSCPWQTIVLHNVCYFLVVGKVPARTESVVCFRDAATSLQVQFPGKIVGDVIRICCKRALDPDPSKWLGSFVMTIKNIWW
jgi:hypothetical protein